MCAVARFVKEVEAERVLCLTATVSSALLFEWVIIDGLGYTTGRQGYLCGIRNTGGWTVSDHNIQGKVSHWFAFTKISAVADHE